MKKTIKIYRHKYHLVPKGIGMLGLGLVLGAVIGSDIVLDKVINIIVKYLGWIYPAFVLNYVGAYDLTLIVIFVTAITLIFGGNGNGGKK
jgi:hypothetical protein